MNKFLPVSLGLLISILFLTNCRQKELDAYYGRPDSLAQPIYQQLEARQHFKNLLACIDKAGYQRILSNAGYWTFFAPNDAAFQAWFTENGISGVDKIDSVTARKIVSYCLVYNAFRQEQLSGYQSSLGVQPAQAFKRKTAYYDFVQTEPGSPRKVIASNRNGIYAVGDNNNKYIPYFTTAFMSAKSLGAFDYNYFYPKSTYSGFNVVDAKVVNADIVAENGIIHEVDRVIQPLKSIDQYLASNPDYSEFRNLLNRMVNYSANADLTHRYNVLTGSTDSVYIKLYNTTLGFSPNNENYLQANTDGQVGGYTLMVPTNDVVKVYVKTLLAYYGTFDAAPPELLSDFLRAHMYTSMVWPSKFTTLTNVQNETPTMAITDIVDKKLLSNGIFYGTNKVQEANVFRTIYSVPYLNPNYSLMTRALNLEIKYSIINPQIKFTMFMMSDNAIRSAYYDWSSIRNDWMYAVPGASVLYGPGPRDRLLRILQTSLLAPTIYQTDLSGKGILETWNGEYIKYDANKIIASGNVDAGNYLVKDSSKTVVNGIVYYTHEVVPTGATSTGGLLTFTEKEIGYHLQKLSVSDPTLFGHFYNYLLNSTIFTAATFAITGTSAGTQYTVLVPTNAAIQDAVKQGILPGNTTTGVPNFKPSAAADIDKVTRFIKYHILNKNTVVTDGRKNGAFETMLVQANGDATFITVINQVDNMQLRDMYNTNVNVVLDKSNNLSNRTVIHSIDNFLKYIY